MENLHVPQGEFQLFRYPKRKKELLRAWDAADEYLLNYIQDLFLDFFQFIFHFHHQALNVGV